MDASTDETDTYAELQDKAVRCALWLQKYVKAGDIISLCTGNHLNSIVPCVAAAYINVIFNTWNENMDLRKIRIIIVKRFYVLHSIKLDIMHFR